LLALIDVFPLMKPNVGKRNSKGEEIARLKHHGIFLLKEQSQRRGRQIVDISCFHQVAHVVPTNLWEKC
jgi:hypothetical protein